MNKFDFSIVATYILEILFARRKLSHSDNESSKWSPSTLSISFLKQESFQKEEILLILTSVKPLIDARGIDGIIVQFFYHGEDFDYQNELWSRFNIGQWTVSLSSIVVHSNVEIKQNENQLKKCVNSSSLRMKSCFSLNRNSRLNQPDTLFDRNLFETSACLIMMMIER